LIIVCTCSLSYEIWTIKINGNSVIGNAEKSPAHFTPTSLAADVIRIAIEAARPALAKITLLLNDIFLLILTFSILLKRKMNKMSEMSVRAIIEGLVRLIR